MNMKIFLGLVVSHLGMGILGFAIGIYALPILIAPESPSAKQVEVKAAVAIFTAKFERDLQDSDALHWGEGQVSISPDTVAFAGELAPGPDYKLYLSPVFVETEQAFNQHKAIMVQVGDIKTFDNFIVALPKRVDPSQFTSVIVWCETFGEFITAAQYQN
jgi:hypothetical protein